MDFTIFSIFVGVFLLAVAAVLIYKLLGLVYPFLFWGGIYVPTSNSRVEKMIKLLDIKPGQKIIDLGAGDGRLLIAAARAGAEAYGCEINPFLLRLARKKIRESGMEDKAFVYQRNLWRQNLGDFNAVAVYPMRHMMGKLEKKFEKELSPGARVVSNYFALPLWKPEADDDKIYFYVKK